MKDELDRLDAALESYLSARKDRKRCNDYCGINHGEHIGKALAEIVDALLDALAIRITEKRQ